jgi:hypothetical protein
LRCHWSMNRRLPAAPQDELPLPTDPRDFRGHPVANLTPPSAVVDRNWSMPVATAGHRQPQLEVAGSWLLDTFVALPSGSDF